MLNKEMSAGTNAGQSTNDDVTSVRPDIGNTNVIGSQSTSYDLQDVEKAKEFIWQRMSNYDKELMIKMSSKTFVERPELKFYLTAAVVKEGITTD